MAIDVESESLIELKKARYPGRDPHVSTKYRHAFSGQLETIKVGGRLYTSKEAILRFVARCNPAIPTELKQAGGRLREIEAANRKLDAIGI